MDTSLKLSSMQALPPKMDIRPTGRRDWRGSIWQCCGEFNTNDTCSCCIVSWIPFLAFGHNMNRAFSLPFLTQMLVFLGCITGPQLLVNFLGLTCGELSAESSDGSQDSSGAGEPSGACIILENLINLFQIMLLVGFLLYAGYRRTQMREKFGLSGDIYSDYFFWFCCFSCTLCQETRTLVHYNVENGVWPDPAERQPILQQSYPQAPPQQGAFADYTGGFTQPLAQQPKGDKEMV